jgi:CheY-like chemotaxis protein
MDMRCPRCGGATEIAGHEDGRVFYVCSGCSRVWPLPLTSRFSHLQVALPPTRVLLADDDEPMVQLVGMWLEDENCEVLRALSGREALDLASAYQPEIAFVDVFMPPPDGYRVCERLKRRAPTEVVLMTGVSMPDLQRAVDVDALMLLRKPFTHEDAVAALAAARRRSIVRLANR